MFHFNNLNLTARINMIYLIKYYYSETLKKFVSCTMIATLYQILFKFPLE